MTRRELTERLKAAAEPVYGEREAVSIARLVAEKRYGLSRADIALEPYGETGLKPGMAGGDPSASIDGNNTFDSMLADLAAARPVQYILGTADFCGLELEVGEGVLIPRPETEELVRFIIKDDKLRMKDLNILDVGTGSGAIAIALAKNLPRACVTAIDVSPEALEYARRNNEKYSAGVTFRRADILDPVKKTLSIQFDLIVSNPPYIPSSERAAMRRNVTEYEPAGALFVPDDDPLLFYRAIAKFAKCSLAAGGALYFEIHEAMGKRVGEMLAAEGFAGIEIHEDINSKPRIIKCLR